MEYLDIIEKIKELQKEIDDKAFERNKLADELVIRDLLSEKEENETMKKIICKCADERQNRDGN